MHEQVFSFGMMTTNTDMQTLSTPRPAVLTMSSFTKLATMTSDAFELARMNGGERSRQFQHTLAASATDNHHVAIAGNQSHLHVSIAAADPGRNPRIEYSPILFPNPIMDLL